MSQKVGKRTDLKGAKRISSFKNLTIRRLGDVLKSVFRGILFAIATLIDVCCMFMLIDWIEDLIRKYDKTKY